MQDGIGRATQSHIDGQCVGEGILGQDVAWTDVPVQQLHHAIAGFLGQTLTGRVDGRDGPVAGKGDAHRLAQAVHAVCGVHAGTGTTGGTAVVLPQADALLVQRAGRITAHRLEHRRQAHAFLVATGHMAGQHRTTTDKDAGQVQPQGRHQHAGDDLVAVGNEDQCVKGVGCRLDLDRVGNQLTASQGIFHAGMAHGDSIADTDAGECDRVAASLPDTCLDRVDDALDADMSGNNLIGGVDDADHRHVQFALGPAKRLHQRPVRGSLDPLGHHFGT